MYINISCARKTIVALAISASLAGCFSEEPPAKDVDWYKANTNERQQMIERCSKNPGELKDSADCKNALAAESALSVGSLK
ncbi:MAG: EexN family lipoprotein [Alishewanella aestuarii]